MFWTPLLLPPAEANAGLTTGSAGCNATVATNPIQANAAALNVN